ncbi:hypothetical protein OG432_34375 [Streptomyces sp. NBC_00442]|uniref:hypothetical protein n=1 Tax=Streptomyces sp. NBC_00442 TaxID=2903651 RepID=UPI002E222527
MNRVTTTVLTAAAAVAAVALTGCGSDEQTRNAPPCPAPIRTTGGDLVPSGVRPCLLTGPSATPSRTTSARPTSTPTRGSATRTGIPGTKNTTRPKTAPPAEAPATRPKPKAPAAPGRPRR